MDTEISEENHGRLRKGRQWVFRRAEDDVPPITREGHVLSLSARKLAAGLWHLEAQTGSFNAGGAGDMTWHWQRSRFGRLLFEYHSPMPILENAVMEGASKWNQNNYNKAATEDAAKMSASALKNELVSLRNRVDRSLFKKKLKNLLRRLSAEQITWIRRERQKMDVIIDELKNEVRRERRNNQKIDIINSKLLSDVADAKLSARQLFGDFQTERKARELLEEICNELVKEIEHSKESLKCMEIECLRIQDEVIEERRMLQLAEVWREERVQMKLMDAKLILEEKYLQMNTLIGEMETFLMSRGNDWDTTTMNEAMRIVQSLDDFSALDVEDLHYTPPRSHDMCTIMEDIQNSGTNESEIDQCLRTSPASATSHGVENVNPEPDEFSQISVHGHSTTNVDFVKEFVNLGKDEQSRHGFIDFVYETGVHTYMSSVVTSNDRIENQEPLSNPGTNMIPSEQQQCKGKGSSIHKPRKSSVSSDGNQRLSTATDSSYIDVSPRKVTAREALNKPEIVTQWSSQGQRNPHISRSMKGCIERPRGIQRYSSKAKVFKFSLGSQKTQVINAFKKRIK